MSEPDPILARLEEILGRIEFPHASQLDIRDCMQSLERDMRKLLADACIEAVESDVIAVPAHRFAIYKRFGVKEEGK